MVDLKDPIQIHLLTETALTDSKEYAILSQDEVDGLKKQIQATTQRVESTRSNLLIQSKYRDAAMSMARLHSPTKADFSEQRLSVDREAEEEREAIQRRCEALAAELFHLEKRLLEPKRRLLEHTAGILQLTHKASKRRGTAANGQAPNGVPGSPESMYTYTQSRNSLDAPDEFYTDDTNFFGLEGLDTTGAGKTRRNPLEIPLKSPIREQQNQLKDELDRVRDEKNYLMSSLAEMERKLAGLNGALHETVIRFNPEGNGDFQGPPATSLDADAIDLLRYQIEYLESGLVAVQAEQENLLNAPRALTPVSNVDNMFQELWDVIQSGYTDIRQRKEERRKARADKGLEDDEEMSEDDGIDLSETYTPLNFSSRVRWLYRQATVLKDQKSVLNRQIKQQRELNNKSDAEKDAELAQKQEELREKDVMIHMAEKDAMDAQKMLSDALEDLEQAREAASSGNPGRTDEMEAKLRELQQTLDESEADSRNTQQRLAQVDASINTLYMQLEEAMEAREEAEGRVDELQTQLAQKQNETDALNASMIDLKTEVARNRDETDAFNASIAALKAEIARKQDETGAFDASMADLKTEVVRKRDETDALNAALAELKTESIRKQDETDALNASITELKAEIARKQDETDAFDASMAELKREAARKQNETEVLNASLVELKTELTIAQAELDGAYGSRAERAADIAAIKASGEISNLQKQVNTLKTELGSTVQELEEMAKETIGSEREKVELENRLDEALSTRASLESEVTTLRERLEADLQKARDKVSHLQEELDGERLRAGRGEGSSRPGIGASMLSEQFRATMREERKRFQEDIKVSRPSATTNPLTADNSLLTNPPTRTQEERTRTRRLEDELARLKRTLGPGKSPLSPR